MPEISKPEAARFWIARNADGSVLHTGRTDTNQVTTTGQPFLEDLADDQELLSAAATWAGQFPPLPATGEPVEAGELYQHDGGVVMARQSHTRTTHAPSEIPALWGIVVPDTTEWAPGQVVAVGDLRTYQGTTYRCVQAHTTQAGWMPPVVPALWEVV